MYVNDDQTATPSKKAESQQSCLPVTMRQLATATRTGNNDKFYIDGVETNNLSIVGFVVDEQTDSSSVTLHVDDGSGVGAVTRWESQEDTARPPPCVGMFVRVIGALREFSGRRTLFAFKVFLVEDYNEVTLHGLEAIEAHLRNTRKKSDAAALAQTISKEQAVAVIKQIVAEALNEGDGTKSDYEGITAEEVTMHLENRGINESLEFVKRAMKELVEEGEIYQGADDDHYVS